MYQQMDEVPDLAVVVLPGKFIKDAVIASAQAGVRGVSTDKPIGAKLSDVDEMIDTCRSEGSSSTAATCSAPAQTYRRPRAGSGTATSARCGAQRCMDGAARYPAADASTSPFSGSSRRLRSPR